MADEYTLDPERWEGAAHAAALFAVDPVGTGGIRLRARAGPVRDAWCAFLDASLPSDMPRVRVPAGVDDGRLLGGLDLAATLQAGRRIVESGLLVAADGGLLTVAMAERLDGATAARIVESLDRGSVALEREGVSRKTATRFGLCLLDEGAEPDEAPPASLLDRTAFHLDLSALSLREVGEAVVSAPEIMAARERLGGIGTDERALEAVCEAAAGLGIASLRAPLLALAAARANAALRNAAAIEEPDLLAALRLVLLPRATRLPAEENAEDSDGPPRPKMRIVRKDRIRSRANRMKRGTAMSLDQTRARWRAAANGCSRRRRRHCRRVSSNVCGAGRASAHRRNAQAVPARNHLSRAGGGRSGCGPGVRARADA